jgi:RNA polymerase sigma-70 factor, ECF subfamily
VQAAARETDIPATQSPPMAPIAPIGLEAVFRRHHEAVFRAAYRITGDAMDAEDVLQTVFTRLLRREAGQAGREGWPHPEHPESLQIDPEGAGSYLHRAAVNAAFDLLRARRRSRAVRLEEVADLAHAAEDPGESPERRPLRRELRTRLREALTRLSPRSAEIFALRYFEGLGNHEIARTLGTSQTAVAVMLHRARHRLQKELAPLGDPS